MRIFGWNLHAKKEPRWAPYEAFAALAEQVNELSKMVQATQRKVYRDSKELEVGDILNKATDPIKTPPKVTKGPGEVLTADEVARIFAGEG